MTLWAQVGDGSLTRADYIVIGSGLTGATIARTLHDAGKDVLVIEARDHVGGNVHDHIHAPTGIRVHTYGPHYFRTSSERIWAWVNRFTSFYKYEAEVRSMIGASLEGWPVSAEYVARECGADWKPSFTGTPSNFEEASLAMMPREIYERFVKGYTEKQWGVPATSLSASLAKRFEVRADGDRRLVKATHQGIPVGGYAAFMRALLRGIPVASGTNWLIDRDRWRARRLTVYTGPVDALFGYDLGKLPYRGQRRRHHVFSVERFAQAVGQVNMPGPERSEIRSLEWKHMLRGDEVVNLKPWVGSVITVEQPYTPTDPDAFEYPFPSDAADTLAMVYRARAERLPRMLVCGRLGEYRYLDMDQAIARALVLAERVLGVSAVDRAA